MSEDVWLNRLCEHVGLETSYWDVDGQHHEVPRRTRKRLLAALGYAADSEKAAAASLNGLLAQDRGRILPPVIVLREAVSPEAVLNLPAASFADRLTWQIKLETGGTLTGDAGPDMLPVQEYLDGPGGEVRSVRLSLPADLPQGYHELEVNAGGAIARARLIITPRRAYLPNAMRDNGVWGLAHQLYSLRGTSDWGIGQFTDLGHSCDRIARAGGDVAGVNPLHALFPGNPQSASPYSPSSRLFLNPIYIDVEAIPEYQGPDAALPDEIRALRHDLSRGERVDYEAAWALKLAVLRQVFAVFESGGASRDRTAAFHDFVVLGGRTLRFFALYQALEAHLGGPAHLWPDGYETPESGDAAAFSETHVSEVRFHAFLQWAAHEQLMQVSGQCSADGMRIGLYGDLAVGADRSGADVWSGAGHYVEDVTFGAPPDPLARQGQNWGLPPFHPGQLREAGYQPFIDILRASMRYYGALRIDHVMWMQRMFWIPAGAETSEGAYMRFPLDDLLAITALESQRNRCCVIGEDLGTVPAGFRETMEDHGLLCYRLMRFERYDNGLFKRPGTYPPLSLATFGSHDLPPISGFWQGGDLDILHQIGLLDDDGLAGDRRLREVERQQLLAALADQGVLGQARLEAGAQGLEIHALIDAVHAFLAKTPSALVMLNLEDVLHSRTQINVPGTYLEYPNWRLRHDRTDSAGTLDHLGQLMGNRSRS